MMMMTRENKQKRGWREGRKEEEKREEERERKRVGREICSFFMEAAD